MKYKAVVTDVDGTLLNSESKLSDFSREVIKKYLSGGGNLILATGKLFKSIDPLCKEFSLTGKQIVGNGALLVEPSTPNTTVLYHMDPVCTRAIIEILKANKVELVIYKPNSILYERGKVKKPNLDLITKGGEGEVLIPESYLEARGVIKILSFVTDFSQEKKIREKVQAICEQVKMLRTSRYYLEFTNKNTSKFNALRQILKELNITFESVAAFGDQENDVDLLQQAGIGVAVGNAPLHVKNTADYVTENCDEDGVAKFIHNFILKDNPLPAQKTKKHNIT